MLLKYHYRHSIFSVGIQIVLGLLFLFTFSIVQGQNIPEKPQPERLVNDFADILSPAEENALEQKLLGYFVKTSTQIAVVSVKSLNGYERADFATRLAQKWGIGSAKNDNGILLLVKPKYSNSKGQLYIAVGYGLEGAATDIAVGQIRTNILIPAFIKNDYYGGINKATDALIALTKGEYNEEQFIQSEKEINLFWIVFAIVIVLIVFRTMKNNKNNDHHNMDSSGGGLPLWMLLEALNGRKGSGSFGDFSSGGGSFGGFGGFGGGSFGGGGAGGSW